MWQIRRWQISHGVFVCYYVAEEQADKYAASALQSSPGTTEPLATNNCKGCGSAAPDPILAQEESRFFPHFPFSPPAHQFGELCCGPDKQACRGSREHFREALEHVNARLLELYPDDEERFDIVLMTNNHAQVGVRLINSINHYGLTIERFCMTGGKSPIGYLTAYLTNLYLSADSEKVQEAIEAGIASATMFTANKDVAYSDTQLRVAFDGDAVLFSDESELIVKEKGLDTFFEHEQLNENKPLAQGPLKGFLEDLGKLQKKFYAKNERLNCPIRTFLVTARSAASSGARVLKTLRSWGLEVDEALFLAGAPKGPILVKIRPHIFFDDQMFHIEGAQKLGTIAAHVPYGIAQKYHKSA
ncbi:PREDICTED: cytosolic 5'-nucleotidase 1B-like [Pygoscelis adeliae]|uniref:cytosolic 5'-nucleotidase 1B-like n=1 Tax=Pygoscelis adeliae TaxID=9238 RepID=UPI0004F4E9D7|nr:PREDICTED: cytosolic 5'-nucleotidase 1B-like [Pygoscelis adeliae]